MKVTLSNIKILERSSQETICFDANLFINGICVGITHNSGHGGQTFYDVPHTNEKAKQLVKEAENYFKSLPPEESECCGEVLKLPRSLHGEIDNILYSHYNELQLKKLKKKLEKKTDYSLIFVDEKFQNVIERRYKHPLKTMMLHFPDKVKQVITEELAANKGFHLFNTNIQ